MRLCKTGPRCQNMPLGHYKIIYAFNENLISASKLNLDFSIDIQILFYLKKKQISLFYFYL